MLTVEIKVNGTVVKHIYAHNANGQTISEYSVVVADVLPYDGSMPQIKEFNIFHKRMDGIGVLVAKILEADEDE